MDNVAISDIKYLGYLSISFNYSGSCCDRLSPSYLVMGFRGESAIFRRHRTGIEAYNHCSKIRGAETVCGNPL
jgi:hypothetical protein